MPKKEKDVIVVIVSQQQRMEEDYKAPRANWWFIDACNNTVYLTHPDKQKCIQYTEENYGAGKYKLQPCKEKKCKGEPTARAFNNSASRKGAMQHRLGII